VSAMPGIERDLDFSPYLQEYKVMLMSVTMVRKLCVPMPNGISRWERVARMTVIVVAAWGAFFVSSASCQVPKAHFYHESGMPPGAIGSVRLARGGPLCGYFQPVTIKIPEGSTAALAQAGTFAEATPALPEVGLLVGSVYRLRVTNIPFQEGAEVFPTVELIDRVYPPRGKELQFPIPIEITAEDLRLAAAGKFVTRVIYVEDPTSAQASTNSIPGEQTWFDVAPARIP